MHKLVFQLMIWLPGSILLGQHQQEPEVHKVISAFLNALSAKDESALRQCWVEQPVAFLPVAGTAGGKRLDREADFLQGWRDVFAAGVRTQTNVNDKPAALRIEPKDMRTDFLSPDVAVVTFHLTANPQALGRRMFVLARTSRGWKITHLHASNMALPAGK
ncbi:MAG TPA: nuclear transport factor 2 family protein [Bryobacteraceae bacterium]|nr:nuclear transport factor 2 family protein [Bryobacteraceae bacterium]